VSNFLAQRLVGYSYRSVDRLRRASPRPLRQFLRRVLERRGFVAFDFFVKSHRLASRAEHDQAMDAARPEIIDDYNRLLAGNVADLLTDVMTKFYQDLGADPRSIALVQGLDRFRSKLSDRKPDALGDQTISILVRFEAAWKLYRSDRTRESIELFETIFRDPTARKKSASNRFVMEAVVRSGEIFGRHLDINGDVDGASAVYREVVALDPHSVVAARLVCLSARRGNLRQAARLAESTIVTGLNLFPHLHDNPYIEKLKAEISRE
jgi:hypothetical protein